MTFASATNGEAPGPKIIAHNTEYQRVNNVFEVKHGERYQFHVQKQRPGSQIRDELGHQHYQCAGKVTQLRVVARYVFFKLIPFFDLTFLSLIPKLL